MGFIDAVSKMFMNFGGRMSGRYRDRASYYDSTYQWLANVPELSGYEDPYQREPNQFMSPHDFYRLQLYKFNRALYRGDHYNAFRFAQYLYNSGMMDDDARLKNLFGKGGVDVLFLAMNLFSLTTDSFADLMVNAVRYVAPAHRDEAAMEAVKRISQASRLKELIHLTSITASFKGDAVWSAHYDEETKQVFLRTRRADTWFPTLDPRDRMEFESHRFAYKTEIGKKTWLAIEDYFEDRIELRVKALKGNELTEDAPAGVFAEVWGPEAREKYPAPLLLCRHLPNKIGDDDDPFGDSDYGRGVLTLADELNHRLTQLGHELDKHANLGMSGPYLGGEETANPSGDNPTNRGAGRKYIARDKDDPEPKYVEYPTAHLDLVMKEVEFLSEEIPRQMRMSPRLLGYKSGAAEEAFDTLRLACVQTLLRNVQRTNFMEEQIRWAFKAAFALENVYKIEGAVDPETELRIGWGDGFPMDEEKRARIWAVRTNNARTATVLQAVEDMDGVDGAQDTTEAIKQEGEDDLSRMTGTGEGPRYKFNFGGGGGEPPPEEPEINAGQEEPGSRTQAR